MLSRMVKRIIIQKLNNRSLSEYKNDEGTTEVINQRWNVERNEIRN